MKRYIKKFSEDQDDSFETVVVDESTIEDKIIDYFSRNPNPSDQDIHNYAKSLQVNIHLFEEIIYKLLGSFLGYGKSKNYTGGYPKEQIKKGIEVELEHTNNRKIALKIVHDHLAELLDYYDRLEKIEK